MEVMKGLAALLFMITGLAVLAIGLATSHGQTPHDWQWWAALIFFFGVPLFWIMRRIFLERRK